MADDPKILALKEAVLMLLHREWARGSDYDVTVRLRLDAIYDAFTEET